MTREFSESEIRSRCTQCRDGMVRDSLIHFAENVKHEGSPYPLDIPSLKAGKCDHCGAIVFTDDSDKQILTALREAAGLLQPAQIEALMAIRGFSQKDLAEKLKVAAASVNRWVRGHVLQSKQNDGLMRDLLEEAHMSTTPAFERFSGRFLVVDGVQDYSAQMMVPLDIAIDDLASSRAVVVECSAANSNYALAA